MSKEKASEEKDQVVVPLPVMTLDRALAAMGAWVAIYGERIKLIAVLATMPDEVFNWFIAWAAGNPVPYPDEGLPDWSEDSRNAVRALRLEAVRLLEAPPGGPSYRDTEDRANVARATGADSE